MPSAGTRHHSDRWNAADAIERAIADHPGYLLRSDPVWVTAAPPEFPLPDAGWKLHLSTRAATLPDLLDLVLPLLLAEGCPFKIVRSVADLARLNDGISAPTSVGKAVTVYPAADRVVDLGHTLARALRGHPGPRVLSDRRIDDDAPVYYRFGPIAPRLRTGPAGRLQAAIVSPGHGTVDGSARLDYRQPDWVDDPFQPRQDAGAVLLGGRYRVISGVSRSALGDVYRAVDQRTDEPVIIKQARALTGETGDGTDARLRLRNERRILQAAADVPGIPRFLDHFAHGPDEFLVLDDRGPVTLFEQLGRTGALLPQGNSTVDAFLDVARQLARTVSDLHRRGVIIRDLTPRNIVLDGDRLSLIDFGIAALDGVHCTGGTPGFAPLRQLRDEPPLITDDGYALGLVLIFAATGAYPVSRPTAPGLGRRRALQQLLSRYGEDHRWLIDLVDRLLSEDPAEVAAALRQLTTPGPSGPRPTPPVSVRAGAAGQLPAVPIVGPDEVARMTARVLDTVVAGVAELAHRRDLAGHDAAVYAGSAGVGLELLEHRSDARVPAAVQHLVRHAAAAMRGTDRPRGWFLGTTGIEVFLSRARDAGFAVEQGVSAVESAELSEAETRELGDDLISGIAGIGLGQLRLHQCTGAPAQLAIAYACAVRLTGRHDLDLPGDSGAGTDGTDLGAGSAHGLAGVIDFLLGYLAQDPDPDLTAPVRRWAYRLRDRVSRLVETLDRPSTTPLAAGWCRGLAGMAPTLLRAGRRLDEPSMIAIGTAALHASARLIPRLENLGQCCGASGLGVAYLDGAMITGDRDLLDHAYAVAGQLLIRSAGPDDQPVFTDPRSNEALTWSMGDPGILTFLRRLGSAGQGVAGGLPFRSSVTAARSTSTGTKSRIGFPSNLL